MTAGSIFGSDLPEAAYSNHGRTVAAWATTVGISLGVLLAAIGVDAAVWAWVWVGSSVAAASLIGGAVLKALGIGV